MVSSEIILFANSRSPGWIFISRCCLRHLISCSTSSCRAESRLSAFISSERATIEWSLPAHWRGPRGYIRYVGKELTCPSRYHSRWRSVWSEWLWMTRPASKFQLHMYSDCNWIHRESSIKPLYLQYCLLCQSNQNWQSHSIIASPDECIRWNYYPRTSMSEWEKRRKEERLEI